MIRADPTDRLVRATSRVDDAALASAVDPTLRDELLRYVYEQPAPGASPAAHPGGRRTRHRALVWACGLTLVAATAAAGYGGWLLIHPEQNTSVWCELGDQPQAYSEPGVSSGDPVADCSEQWRRELGDPVPALAAFATETGAVVVRPVAWPVPEGWRALPEGFGLDPAVHEAERIFSDQIHGLADRCRDETDAERLVRSELTRLALPGWQIGWRREFDGSADGERLCGRFMGLDPDHREVILGAEPSATADLPDQRMAEQLRGLSGCPDRDQALAAVRKAGAAAGIPEGPAGYTLQELSQPASPCARVTMAVGGAVTIQVSGG
jgi:hypothetical protein